MKKKQRPLDNLFFNPFIGYTQCMKNKDSEKNNKVYYNPKCSKCRIAKDYLEKNDIQFSLIEYLKVGISKKDIENILKVGNFNILDIIRKNEEEYKEYIKDQKLSESQIIDILCKYPKLLQRPLIFNNKKALIARDEKTLNKIKL